MIPTFDLANSLRVNASAEGTHLFWRITNIAIPTGGASLDISEIQVFANGVDVTASATKTTSDTPTGNNFTALFDGSTTSADVNWSTAVLSGLWIKFEFPTSVEITGVKQGTWDQALRYIFDFTLESSDDDSIWNYAGNKSGLSYPGDKTLSTEYTFPDPPPSGTDAHRYWRINGINIPSADLLEISELQVLENSSNVTASALTTVQADPDVFGVASSLFDGNLATRCVWTNAVAEGAGFWIKFDFGIGVEKEINGVKQGGFDTATRYMESFTLQWSDDNVNWTTLGSKSGLTYPGDNTLSSEYTFP